MSIDTKIIYRRNKISRTYTWMFFSWFIEFFDYSIQNNKGYYFFLFALIFFRNLRAVATVLENLKEILKSNREPKCLQNYRMIKKEKSNDKKIHKLFFLRCHFFKDLKKKA